MNISHATEKDAQQLVLLLAQVSYEMSEEAMHARIAAFTAKNHQILVVEENSKIIGVIAFACYEQFRLSSSCCHIDTLVVHKSYQGRGVGKKLVALAESYASAAGAKTVELIAANFRRKSGIHSFYESLGYKDHLTLDYSYFAKENE